MAKYQWNYSEIKKNMELLQSYLVRKTENYDWSVIEDTLKQYQRMLYFFTKGKSYQDPLQIEMGKNFSLDTTINYYLENVCLEDASIIDCILKTFPIIKDFRMKSPYYYIVPFTNDRLLELTEEFLETLPSSIQQKWQKMKEENPNYLHIHYFDSMNNGELLIDPILKKKYILINRQNQPIDLTTLPHEIFHFLFCDYNSYETSTHQVAYIQEVEGSLANLLMIDYLREINSDLSKQLSEDLLLYYQIRTDDLVILNAFLQSLKKDKLRRHKMEKYLNYFEVCQKMNENNIKKQMQQSNAQDDMNYNLSFLASLDLYNIYHHDPEFAFYLLQNLKFSKTDDHVFSLLRRNHITFMEDGYQNLKKYVKKVESFYD